MKFECIVVDRGVYKKFIRYYDSVELAFAWLELEGYKVISLRELPEKFNE